MSRVIALSYQKNDSRKNGNKYVLYGCNNYEYGCENCYSVFESQVEWLCNQQQKFLSGSMCVLFS